VRKARPEPSIDVNYVAFVGVDGNVERDNDIVSCKDIKGAMTDNT
jgi:hypothetical protein